MRHRLRFVCLFIGLTAGYSAAAWAQAPALPPAPPKTWTLAAGGGLSFTSGNTETTTMNAGYDITYDPQTRNRLKSDGLYLRGKTGGELSTNRLGLNGRDEYRIYSRAFVFGQTQFLKDRFKEIDYLVAPTAGIGYRVADSPNARLSVDIGLGGIWEKNQREEVHASGAFAFAEKLSRQISAAATLTQSLSALHKTDDFGDALYQTAVGIGAAITARTQLKVEVLDTFKNKVPDPSIVRNDVALVLALVFKN